MPPRARGRLRKAFAVLVLATLTTAFVSWTASAAISTALPRQSDSTTAGGCDAFVAGQPVGKLDVDHPLQVYKHQRIVVTGLAALGAVRGYKGRAWKV